MNNNLFSENSRNLIKTASILKKMLAAIIIIICFGFNNVFAQAAVTAPSLTVTACPTFPTNPGTLGDIVITETAAGDISGSGTVILSAPANFKFTSAGTASATGTEITGVSIVLTNDTALTLSFTVAGVIELNALTISGIQVIGINSATAASNITQTGGTAVIIMNVNTSIHAILTSTLSPTLNSTLSPPSVCSGTAFSYTPTSAIPGATFAWTRAVVAGISNPANNGTDDPNETLINTAADSVLVTYIYTVTANGCTNLNTDSVIVAINSLSTSVLSATANPNPVLSGDSTLLTENGGSLGTGAAYNWYSGACGGTLVGNGSSIYVNPTLITTYFVRAQGTCNTTTCASVTVNLSDGIQEVNSVSGISIFPNPFTAQTTISFSKEIKNAKIEIVDVLGKVVKNIDFSGSQLVIVKGELDAGTYFIRVVSGNELMANEKIIIR